MASGTDAFSTRWSRSRQPILLLTAMRSDQCVCGPLLAQHRWSAPPLRGYTAHAVSAYAGQLPDQSSQAFKACAVNSCSHVCRAYRREAPHCRLCAIGYVAATSTAALSQRYIPDTPGREGTMRDEDLSLIPLISFLHVISLSLAVRDTSDVLSTLHSWCATTITARAVCMRQCTQLTSTYPSRVHSL